MPEDTSKQVYGAEITFERGLGLFDASMIGIGAMIGAGIFVLTGIAAGEAGPGAIVSFALNGFVTLLTALCYAELASAYPKSGGGYSFIRKAFPGIIGFTSGWMLWFCYIIACALYALGFGSYFWEFGHTYFPGVTEFFFSLAGEKTSILIVTSLISIAFILINIRGTGTTASLENLLTMAKIMILTVFIFYGLNQILDAPDVAVRNFNPFLPRGFSSVFLAMGLTFIAFEGYDLIATVAEEIKNPEKTIPRATFISLIVTVTIYLLIAVVCIGAIHYDSGASWEFLGKYQEIAIVKAASNFMPVFGVTLIIFGGLLSTLSALNATILASSRVAFSMGRDKMLHSSLSKIHPVRRTPHIAVAVTGVIIIVIALLFPIQVIGSAASVMFLLTFTLVNLSLITLRRKFPEKKQGFRVPLYPITPLMAMVLNIGLAVYQFWFDPRSWFIALAWLISGTLVYFVFFRKIGEAYVPKVLEVHQHRASGHFSNRILIPLHNPDHVIQLMSLAIPIAKETESEIIVLGVIPVPQNLPMQEGMNFINQKTPLLENAIQYGQEKGVEVRSAIRIAHRVSDGIIHAAEAEQASLIVMGWKGYTTTGDRIMGEVTDKVVRYTPCDLITIKLTGDQPFKRIIMPTAGGPHAMLAAQYVSYLRESLGCKVVSCYVVKPNADERARKISIDWIQKTIHRSGLEGKTELQLIEGENIVFTLARMGGEMDLIVLGATKESVFSSVLFGEIPEKVARYSKSPVMIVKRYEGTVKSIINKIFG